MQEENEAITKYPNIDLERFFSSFRTEKLRANHILQTKEEDESDIEAFVRHLDRLYTIYRAAILKNGGDNAFAKEFYSSICGSIFYYFGKTFPEKTTTSSLHDIAYNYDLRTTESDESLVVKIRAYYGIILKVDETVYM